MAPIIAGSAAARPPPHEEFFPPEVIYVGFKRISSISQAQQLKLAEASAATQDLLITVSVLDHTRYTFTTTISRHADISTLARSIEMVLTAQRTAVACLVDLGSDNILRWTDAVDDVLDGDSIVGVLPLTPAAVMGSTTGQNDRPSPSRSRTSSLLCLSAPSSSTVPQSEFGAPSDEKTRGAADEQQMRPPLVGRQSNPNMRSMSWRSTRKAEPPSPNVSNGKVMPAMQAYDIAPVTDIHRIPRSPDRVRKLLEVTHNAILLRDFCRFCARRRTLIELLFWLDTATAYDETYVERVYLRRDAVLHLNMPPDVHKVDQARLLLQEGALAWCFELFEASYEGAHTTLIQTEQPALYARAQIELRGLQDDSRQQFVKLLSQVLNPADTTILALKERKEVRTRQSILDRICEQYLPDNQVDTRRYFELREEHMTLPERNRLTKRRIAFGGLFDQRPGRTSEESSVVRGILPRIRSDRHDARSIMSETPAATFYEHTRDFLDDARAVDLEMRMSRFNSPLTTPHIRAPETPLTDGVIAETMQPTDDVEAAEDDDDDASLASDLSLDSQAERAQALRMQKLQTAQKLSSLLGMQVGTDGSVYREATPRASTSESGRKRPSTGRSAKTRSISGASNASPVMKSPSDAASSIIGMDEMSASRRAEIVKRQNKLRNVLGINLKMEHDRVIDDTASIAESVDAQSFRMGRQRTPSVAGSRLERSPNGSIRSRFSNKSGYSTMSRATRDADAERRLQARKAAKLYAQFGSHTTERKGTHLGYANAKSVKTRQSIENMRNGQRRETAMSQYAPSIAHSNYAPSIGRASISGRSIGGAHGGRYMPDRAPASSGNQQSLQQNRLRSFFGGGKDPAQRSTSVSSQLTTGGRSVNRFGLGRLDNGSSSTLPHDPYAVGMPTSPTLASSPTPGVDKRSRAGSIGIGLGFLPPSSSSPRTERPPSIMTAGRNGSVTSFHTTRTTNTAARNASRHNGVDDDVASIAHPDHDDDEEAGGVDGKDMFDDYDNNGGLIGDIEEADEEDDDEEELVQDVRQRMKLKQMLGYEGPAI